MCIGMHDRDPSWDAYYMLWPHGPCHRVMMMGEGMEPYDYAQITGQIAHDWRYPHGRYADAM